MLLKGVNYLVRTGYSWTEVMGMSMWRLRKLCEMNALLDTPTSDGGAKDPDQDKYVGSV